MTTTAEGVETQEQLNALRALGCTQMQGYLVSAAVPAAAARSLLSQMRLAENTARAGVIEPSRQLGAYDAVGWLVMWHAGTPPTPTRRCSVF